MTRLDKATIGLSALSGLSSALVGAVSLTRIAGDQLGFPHGLAWTLTASSDIGATAGAIMWVASAAGSSTRRIGVPLNIVCTALSATIVGLDHANNADKSLGWVWPVVGFIVGVFLPMLTTWLVHGLATMAAARVQEQAQPETAPQTEPVVEQAPAPVEPVVSPPPAEEVASVGKQQTLKSQVREEWMRQAKEVLAAGGDLSSIVLAEVDRVAGAKPGYAKKHVAYWRSELEAGVA